LPTLDEKRIAETLALALRIVGVAVEASTPCAMLDAALVSFRAQTRNPLPLAMGIPRLRAE